MRLKFIGFEWDSGNSAKCEKHRVRREDIEDFLLHGDYRIFPDSKHSLSEQRLLAIGLTTENKRMFVGFVVRNHKIRVITARYMHKKEYDRYA